MGLDNTVEKRENFHVCLTLDLTWKITAMHPKQDAFLLKVLKLLDCKQIRAYIIVRGNKIL